MKDGLFLGMVIGACVGGYIIYSCPKCQKMINKGKDTLKETLNGQQQQKSSAK